MNDTLVGIEWRRHRTKDNGRKKILSPLRYGFFDYARTFIKAGELSLLYFTGFISINDGNHFVFSLLDDVARPLVTLGAASKSG